MSQPINHALFDVIIYHRKTGEVKEIRFSGLSYELAEDGRVQAERRSPIIPLSCSAELVPTGTLKVGDKYEVSE